MLYVKLYLADSEELHGLQLPFHNIEGTQYLYIFD
jgi:hypothetical protein